MLLSKGPPAPLRRTKCGFPEGTLGEEAPLACSQLLDADAMNGLCLTRESSWGIRGQEP
jgi:hypothetical protein